MKKEEIKKIKEEIKKELPEFYEDLIKNNISDSKILEIYPIFLNYFKNEKKINHTLEFYVNLDSIQFKAIPKNEKINLEQKASEIKENYLISDFSKEKFSLSLNNDIEKTTGRKKILTFIKTIIDSFPESKGYWLYGDIGVGKTFITIAMLNHFASKGNKVALVSLSKLIIDLKSSFSNQKSSFYEETTNNLMNVDILVFDDIGSENLSDWLRDEILFPVLNHRLENKRMTCFISNFSINEYQKELRSFDKVKKVKNDRFIDRIKSLSIEIEQEGSNRRKN